LIPLKKPNLRRCFNFPVTAATYILSIGTKCAPDVMAGG